MCNTCTKPAQKVSVMHMKGEVIKLQRYLYSIGQWLPLPLIKRQDGTSCIAADSPHPLRLKGVASVTAIIAGEPGIISRELTKIIIASASLMIYLWNTIYIHALVLRGGTINVQADCFWHWQPGHRCHCIIIHAATDVERGMLLALTGTDAAALSTY